MISNITITCIIQLIISYLITHKFEMLNCMVQFPLNILILPIITNFIICQLQKICPDFYARCYAPDDDLSAQSRGLSELVYQCLGFPLDKREQYSNWERRPLRKSQLIYAGICHC